MKERFNKICSNQTKRLLSETDLGLEKAINLSVVMETAARDAAEVQGIRNETVQKISTRPKRTFNRNHTVKPTNTQ